MNAEKAVVHILQNDATFYALVGGSAIASRVYYDEIEQGSVFPNVMVTAETVDTNDTKDNSDFDSDLIQVFHSGTKAQALNMAAVARTVLTAVRNTSHNGIFVNEIRYVDGDSFTEKIVDKKVFTIEQLYRVLINN